MAARAVAQSFAATAAIAAPTKRPIRSSGSGDARDGTRRCKIEPGDLRVRYARAQDHALELSVMTDVDGIARKARDLVAGFHPRCCGLVAVEAARTGLRHRAEDSLIGAAAAE